jgi:hypothetical protein
MEPSEGVEQLSSCDCAASEDGNPHHQGYCRSLPTSERRERHKILAESYSALAGMVQELSRQVAGEQQVPVDLLGRDLPS